MLLYVWIVVFFLMSRDKIADSIPAAIGLLIMMNMRKNIRIIRMMKINFEADNKEK